MRTLYVLRAIRLMNSDNIENLEYFYVISENMIFNKNYGFAFLIFKEDKITERLCSPFIRKDTPVKNSEFSSLLLTLILTFKSYIQLYTGKLQDFDYKNIDDNLNILDEFVMKL